MTYTLIDSGDEQKLERFGDVLLSRPSAQAVWRPQLPKAAWDKADATFSRLPSNQWKKSRHLPTSWVTSWQGIDFKIAPTDFGHVGLFPEHGLLWKWMGERIEKNDNILNLFAYTGGATLFLAKKGAKLCHVDASKGIITWARENAALNDLEKAPIRWIVDDVLKFLTREVRRGVTYEGILLDPPTFGRGNKGEVFKIERDLIPILDLCVQLLSKKARFLLLTCHTPGYTPLVLDHLLHQVLKKGTISSGELIIPSTELDLPSGTYARWHADH